MCEAREDGRLNILESRLVNRTMPPAPEDTAQHLLSRFITNSEIRQEPKCCVGSQAFLANLSSVFGFD